MEHNLFWVLIVGTATAIVMVLKEVFKFIKDKNKDDCENDAQRFITYKEFANLENQYYNDFVTKEVYDKEFNEVRGELKEIKANQKEQSRDIQDIKLSVVATTKDIEFIKSALANLPKRQND